MYRSKKKKTKMKKTKINKSRRKNNKGGAGCRDCPQNLRDDIDKFLHLVKHAHSGASQETQEKSADCYDYLVKKVQSIPCEIRKNLMLKDRKYFVTLGFFVNISFLMSQNFFHFFRKIW